MCVYKTYSHSLESEWNYYSTYQSMFEGKVRVLNAYKNISNQWFKFSLTLEKEQIKPKTSRKRK